MKISTKGRYALRVMTDLSQHIGDEYVSINEISKRQGISMKYLEMIVGMLHKSGYVISHRGKTGGYKLAKTPVDYTVGSILKLTEGSLSPVACLDCETNECPRADQCVTLPMWQKLDKLIDGYLESITIKDLIDEQSKTAGNEYCI